MSKITMQEIRERGLDDDAVDVVNEMVGERLPSHVAKHVPMADLALFGYGPPCPCGERGMLPGETIVENADGEMCAECAAIEAAS